MRRFTKVALVLGVLAVAAGSIAWGGHARGGFAGRMIGARLEKALDYVDATPQQRAVVAEARASITDKIKAHHAAAKGLPEEMAQLLAADHLDVAGLNTLVDQKAEQMKAIAKELAPEIVKVHDAFTPQQRAKLYSKWQEMRAQHSQRRQQHEGDKGGFGGTEQ